MDGCGEKKIIVYYLPYDTNRYKIKHFGRSSLLSFVICVRDVFTKKNILEASK